MFANNTQSKKESIALFENNVYRLEALALESIFKRRAETGKICEAIKAAYLACEEQASFNSVHGLALAKF